MEEVMPMQLVKNNFKAEILKLRTFLKRDLVCFYEAETCYGRMTLIVQQFFCQTQKQGQQKVQNEQVLVFIDERNKLLKKQQIVCPLIYEQEIKRIRQNYFICLTLTEPLQSKKREDLLTSHSIALYENLVQCASKIDNTEFQYDPSCYLLQHFISSVYSDQLYLDFTMITKRKSKNSKEQVNNSDIFISFKAELCRIISTPRPGKISEIFFVKQKSVVFNVEALIAAKNWGDLALIFNLLQNELVTILNEKKIKISPISRLQGCVSIDYKGMRFDNLNFQDGYRVDGFRQVTYPQLKADFFQQKITYIMSKRRYQSVRKRYNSEQCWIKDNIQFSDLIIVKEEITKAEFISFLIGYFKYIEPTLHTIKYIAEENALQIEYFNRVNQAKSVLMKFTGKYVVKDQEITMIIEKGRLKNTNLDLTKMQITDSCLVFLANCDKLLNVASLDISYCPNLSQSGIQLLFASPMCKKLKALRMSGLTVPDFSVAKFKKELKELKINNGKGYDEECVISDWKLENLEALGLNLSLNLPETLKYLVLSNEVYLQQIKMLRNLSLVHLKIKLVENKKNISNFFSNFYIKQNPVRSFAEGNSKTTLKYLDISQSTVKLRELKPILQIECLQTFVCECIEKDKFQDCTLPQNIVNISFKSSLINIQQVTQLISKTSIIISLNLCKTNVDDAGVESFVKTKKHINFLEIQQEQFTINMLQKKNGIQVINLHLFKLIRDEHQILLNTILLNQTETNKQMNLICEERLEAKLIAKVHRFTMFYQAQLSKMLATNINISINSIPIWKLINYQFNSTHNEYINILKEHQKPHKVRVSPSSVISEIALQGIELHMEAFNVFLHKTLSLHTGSLLEICIRSNRVLSKQVIRLIRKYAGNLLKQIDFRDCIFSFQDVKQQLYLFPILQCVNQGEYQISLTEQDNCELQLQKILKFFMKLKLNQKIKLSIQAQQLAQRQLFYSILYQILHHYRERILSLSVDFRNMRAQGSEIFWKQVFGLSNLQAFKVSYYNDILGEDQILTLANQFKNISHFHLYSLDLSTNIPNLLSNNLTFLDIKKLHLDFSGSYHLEHRQVITQPILHKMLKNLTNLIHLDLRIPNSQSLCSLRKLSDAIEKMTQLVHLALNIENSAVKEQQIFELVYCLHKNKNLERFQLNINNINISISQLIKFCQIVQKQNKYCHIVIYALQAKKQMLNRDQNELLSKGIEIIHSECQ